MIPFDEIEDKYENIKHNQTPYDWLSQAEQERYDRVFYRRAALEFIRQARRAYKELVTAGYKETPAAEGYIKRAKPLTGMSISELRKQVEYAESFLNAETSTVEGAKQMMRKIEESVYETTGKRIHFDNFDQHNQYYRNFFALTNAINLAVGGRSGFQLQTYSDPWSPIVEMFPVKFIAELEKDSPEWKRVIEQLTEAFREPPSNKPPFPVIFPRNSF